MSFLNLIARADYFSVLMQIPFPIIIISDVLMVMFDFPVVHIELSSDICWVVGFLLYNVFQGIAFGVILFVNLEHLIRFYYTNIKCKLVDSLVINAHLFIMFSVTFIKLFVIMDSISKHNNTNNVTMYDILQWIKFDRNQFNLLEVLVRAIMLDSSHYLFSSIWLFSFVLFYQLYLIPNVFKWRTRYVSNHIQDNNTDIMRQIIVPHVLFIDDIAQIIMDYTPQTPQIFLNKNREFKLYQRMACNNYSPALYTIISVMILIFLYSLSMAQMNVITICCFVAFVYRVVGDLLMLFLLLISLLLIFIKKIWTRFLCFCKNNPRNHEVNMLETIMFGLFIYYFIYNQVWIFIVFLICGDLLYNLNLVDVICVVFFTVKLLQMADRLQNTMLQIFQSH